MKIALLGGAFDPIHKGHCYLAQVVAKFVDQVWLLPAYDHMYGKKMASSEHRLKMCNLAVEQSPKIKVSDFEIANQCCSGTYQMLNLIRAAYPQHIFYFIIGQDNADSIEQWKHYEQLLATTPFIVVPRSGYQAKSAWYHSYPHHYLADSQMQCLPQISSTTIRQQLQDGLNPKHAPQQVIDYINKKGLYSS